LINEDGVNESCILYVLKLYKQRGFVPIWMVSTK